MDDVNDHTDTDLATPRADVSTVEEQSQSDLGIQKRLAERHAWGAQVTVEYLELFEQIHDAKKRFWVTTRDISTSGVSFHHCQMMYYGERIRMELRLKGGNLRYVTARIVRCRRCPDGTFEIGAAFEQNDGVPPAEPKDGSPDAADL
jgi:hypothetical protein